MLDISSIDAAVSSIEAACVVAESASWLPAAEA